MSNKPLFDRSQDEPSLSQKERGGMFFVLFAGLTVLGGNLFLTWKMQAWNFDSWGFYINSSYTYWRSVGNFLFFNILLHLPCIPGTWMIWAAVKYFWRNRKKQD